MVDIAHWQDKNPLILVNSIMYINCKPRQQPDMLHHSGHVTLPELVCQFRLRDVLS